MKKFRDSVFVGLVAVLGASFAVPSVRAEPLTEPISLRQQISTALAAGEIDQQVAADRLLTRIFAPEKALDPRPIRREFCGNAIADLVAENWDRLDPALRESIPDHYRPAFARKAAPASRPGDIYCDAYLDSERFRIHYATSGEHAVPGLPDLTVVQNLADYLEYAYDVEAQVLGVPYGDGGLGGGMDLIDCYVYYPDDGIFGRAYATPWVADACPNSTSGFMEIVPDFEYYEPESQHRLTSSHELFHLVQYAVDFRESSWMDESTARRTEGLVWPSYEMMRGIGTWFLNPQLGIWDESSIRKYSPHYWHFLEATLGDDIMSAVWLRCCDTDWRSAIYAEIAARGSDFDTQLVQFSIWNAITGKRDDGLHYPLGSTYPSIWPQGRHDPPILADSLRDTQMPAETGSNYFRFYGPATENTLRLTYDGEPEIAPYRRVSFVASRGASHVEWTLAPDGDGDVVTEIPDWGLYDEVTMIVTSLPGADTAQEFELYTYSAEEIAAEAADLYAGGLRSAFPNPLVGSTEIRFEISEPSATRIDVCDIAGRHIRQLVDRPLYAGEHYVLWDGRDRGGVRVADGVYFVRLSSGGMDRTMKVMVIE